MRRVAVLVVDAGGSTLGIGQHIRLADFEDKSSHHSVTLNWPTAGDRLLWVRGWVEPAGVERTYLYRVVAR